MANRFYKKKGDNFYVQKLLCKRYLVFYSVVQFYVGEDLDREALIKALSLAERKPKAQLENQADVFFEQYQGMIRRPSSRIPFSAFYKIITAIHL